MKDEIKVIHTEGSESTEKFKDRLMAVVDQGFTFAGIQTIPEKPGPTKATSTPRQIVVYYKPKKK